MATKVKPTRLQVTGTPQLGDVPVYVDQDTFQWGAGGGGGGGDVSGPASSTDGDIVLFDGTTGKAIQDSGKKLSDYQERLTAQTAYTSQGTSSKVPQITTNSLGQVTGITEVSITHPSQVSDTAYGSGWDGQTTTAPSQNAVYDKINSIDALIPGAATSSNQLSDKDYVNDSINSITAYYITKNAQGDQWATYAELAAASTFYSGGVARTPTRNDYTIVLADENHDNATTRYIYQNNQWEFQYIVNETALTQAQLDALNSGITANKVSTYDGYASTISGKQDALTLPATPTQGNLVTWGADNETLVDGGAIPSTADCVKTSGDQTIAGTKTFSTSPVVPNKTSDATNTGTAIATEAQVYKKQDALTTQTAYTTKGTATKVPTISTNTLGQVTAITETNITFPVTSVNGQTGAVTLSIPSITSTTATLTVGGWSSSTQTVSVTGVTATNQVIVAPDPSDLDEYTEKGVYCSGQGSGTLTFTCDTTPTASITVNVLIMNL